MNRRLIIGAAVGLILVVIMGAVLIRLNLYRYDKQGEQLIRTNRLSGRSEILTPPNGWIPMSGPEPSPSPPPEQVLLFGSLLTEGRGGFAGPGINNFSGSLYNRSDATITGLTVEITQCPTKCLVDPPVEPYSKEAYDKMKEEMAKKRATAGEVKRQYSVKITLPPKTAGSLSFYAINEPNMPNMTWNITEVRGHGDPLKETK